MGRQTLVLPDELREDADANATFRGAPEAVPDLGDDTGAALCERCWTVLADDAASRCPECGGAPDDGSWGRLPYLVAGRYECFRLLGRGAMGAVLLARDRSRGAAAPGAEGQAPVAVKLVQRVGGEAMRETLRQMFAHEAGVATLLGRTELFVKVLGHQSETDPYLVMEYVPWRTLKHFLADRGALPAPAVVRLGLALLEAVEVMHFYRIVHRDLKPSNLFVQAHGQRFKLKIADLGVWTRDHDAVPDARSDGLFVGSLFYTSPEQMACEPVGARSDLHAVGSILWEAATGAVPFAAAGDDFKARLADRRRRAAQPPARPEAMPGPLYEVLARALACAPEARFASARAMADALRAAGGMELLGPPPGQAQPAPEQEAAQRRATLIVGDADSQIQDRSSRLEGTFDIYDLIGAGGTSRVYEAYQRSLDRRVALKLLNHTPPRGFTEEQIADLFRAEARAASRLLHPHIVRVFDFGYDAEGLPYVAREYLDGDSLDDRLDAGLLDEGAALAALTPVAGTLVEAHARGIIHRNLKPHSVWLVPVAGAGEVVKVANYGLDLRDLELLPQGLIFGTPKFMAPEQIQGRLPSPASDLYALGSLLYYAVSPEAPYRYQSTAELLRAKLRTRPWPLTEAGPHGAISRAYRAVTNVLLVKDPALRPGADDVHRWLSALRAGADDEVPVQTLEQRFLSA